MKKIILLVLLTSFYSKLSAQLQPNGHTIKNLNFLSTVSNFPVGRVFQVYPSNNSSQPAEMYVTGWSGTVQISKNFAGSNRWTIVNFTQGGGTVIWARTAINNSIKVPCSTNGN